MLAPLMREAKEAIADSLKKGHAPPSMSHCSPPSCSAILALPDVPCLLTMAVAAAAVYPVFMRASFRQQSNAMCSVLSCLCSLLAQRGGWRCSLFCAPRHARCTGKAALVEAFTGTPDAQRAQHNTGAVYTFPPDLCRAAYDACALAGLPQGHLPNLIVYEVDASTSPGVLVGEHALMPLTQCECNYRSKTRCEVGAKFSTTSPCPKAVTCLIGGSQMGSDRHILSITGDERSVAPNKATPQ